MTKEEIIKDIGDAIVCLSYAIDRDKNDNADEKLIDYEMAKDALNKLLKLSNKIENENTKINT